MKKLFTFFGILSSAIICNAGVLTVSNNTNLPGTPGQYSTIAAGIAAASNGDTLLIQGSPFDYNETITLSKSLTLIGAGYNPQSSSANRTYIVGTFSFGNGSSGSKLIGIKFGGNVNFNNSFNVQDFTISRCQISGATTLYNGSQTSTNKVTGTLIVENCVLEYYIGLRYYAATIKNNVFTNPNAYVSGGASIPGTIPSHSVKNNLFLCAAAPIADCQNSIVENNVFYSATSFTTASNNSFNNNYVYGLSTLPPAGNSGGGNITNQIYPYNNSATICTFNLTENYRPLNTSPLINGGTDGTDIGPTGGANPIYASPSPYPLTGEAPIPQVYQILMPVSSAPDGGTINVTVKARKRN